MVKDMEVEFGKKKIAEEGTKTKKRKQDKMEEPPVPTVPFKKKSIFFKYLSYWKTLGCTDNHLPVLVDQAEGGCSGQLWANHRGPPKYRLQR
jgi:hypothetical protein